MAVPAGSVDEGLVATDSGIRAPRRWWPAFWLAALVFAGLGLVLAAISGWSDAAGGYGFPGFSALFAISYGSMGALVLRSRPGNRVGRVLLASGVLAGAQTLWTEYAVVGLITAPGSLPLAVLAAWLVSWAWMPFVFLAAPVLLSIFPDGRLLSRRWAATLAAILLFGNTFMLIVAFTVGPRA